MGTLSKYKIVVVNQGVPHESRGASTVLFYHYLDAIKEEGATIQNYLLLQGQTEISQEVRNYAGKMASREGVEVTPVFAKNFYLPSRFSAKLNTTLFEGVKNKIRSFNPDLIVCLDIMAAWALFDLPHKKVVWLGDLNFQTFWHHAIFATKENPSQAVRLPLVISQCLNWRRIYRHTLEKANAVVVSSASSVEALGKLGVKSQYLPYPWPAEEASPGTVSLPRTPSFSFFGNLAALGSRSAFHFLFGEVYPHLLRIFGAGQFSITIYGSGKPPAWALEEIRTKSEIRFGGFVEDIGSAMRGSHAVLVPIDIPVGNRSRILTAMAHGGLVVTHRNAAAGNSGLRHQENCFLADDAKSFAGWMKRAFDDSDERSRIIVAARDFYLREFAPMPASRNFIHVMRMLLD